MRGFAPSRPFGAIAALRAAARAARSERGTSEQRARNERATGSQVGRSALAPRSLVGRRSVGRAARCPRVAVGRRSVGSGRSALRGPSAAPAGGRPFAVRPLRRGGSVLGAVRPLRRGGGGGGAVP